jgi:hypothetical protein
MSKILMWANVQNFIIIFCQVLISITNILVACWQMEFSNVLINCVPSLDVGNPCASLAIGKVETNQLSWTTGNISWLWSGNKMG